MTLEQSVEYLLSHSKLFERDVIRDTDRHGRDFCEMIIKNENQPSFPITVSVTENGCSLSVGQIEEVTGNDQMTAGETLAAIKDIIEDRILFVLAYRDDDDLGFGSPFFSRIFAITGGDDDMSEEYDRFIKKISKPISRFLRPVTVLKGKFMIFNFSGSVSKKVVR